MSRMPHWLRIHRWTLPERDRDCEDFELHIRDDFGDGQVAISVEGDELVSSDVLEVHRSVMTFGTLKSFTLLAASELPVRGKTRSSRTACLTLVTTCAVG